jgi:phage recombination protein Bet
VAETDTMEAPAATTPAPSRAVTLVREDMKWLDIPRDKLVETLRTSLFPGAKPDSVMAVLDYCEAARLNVMLKPVHIVPMSVKKPGTNQYEMRDVVMPGINHYRTQASRSGDYLGMSEPEFGPTIELTFGQFKIHVPEWCKVTVKRLVGGHIAEFPAIEYWQENYATKGRDSDTPNQMWQKRPRGQLLKCTEAQALRKAFPELGGDPTAEEMEGKVIDLTPDAEGVHKPAAARTLDQFAGTNEVADPGAAGVEDIRGDDAEADANLSDECPEMPLDIAQVFYNPAEGKEADWLPGWKWLNEVAPGLTGPARQALAEDHARLLWAVHDSDAKAKKGGGPQSKAALKFVEEMGMVVPDVEGRNV